MGPSNSKTSPNSILTSPLPRTILSAAAPTVRFRSGTRSNVRPTKATVPPITRAGISGWPIPNPVISRRQPTAIIPVATNSGTSSGSTAKSPSVSMQPRKKPSVLKVLPKLLYVRESVTVDSLVNDELQGVDHVVGDDHDQQASSENEDARQPHPEQSGHDDPQSTLRAMAEPEGHRGADDEQPLWDPEPGVDDPDQCPTEQQLLEACDNRQH